MFSTNIIDGGGKTRLKPIANLAVHLDYLRFRAENLTTQAFESLLNFTIDNYGVKMYQPWTPGGGAVWYEHKLIGINGFVGGFTTNSDGLISCMVDLSGSYFEQLDLIGQWRLLLGLTNAYGVKCSRIDIAIDDPTYSVIPVSKMRKAWERGENFGFRKHRYIESGETPEDLKKSWYFGSRESGKCNRIYDHEGECMRHETEFKRGYAQEVMLEITEIKRPDFTASMQLDDCEEDDPEKRKLEFVNIISKKLASIVLGSMDFRNRGNREDRSRAGYRDSERLDFYQEYIDFVCGETYKVTAPRPSRSLTKTVDWMKRQVASTLSMMQAGLGRFNFNIWLQDLVLYGEERRDKLKDMWIAEMRRNPKIIRV